MRYTLILPLAMALSDCTTAQLQKAESVQAKVEAAVAANAVKIQAACADVLLVANNPLTDVAAASVPVVGQVQGAVKAGCATAESIAVMAQSASTVDWLASAKQVMASQGTVLPAPVAPVPVAPTS